MMVTARSEKIDRVRGFDAGVDEYLTKPLDGYELTRALRALPRMREVPIMMVTARSEKIDRVRGFDAGVDEYLTKPLDGGELVRALEKHLGRPHRSRR
jgi:DNA-binding response OmpR family regulator